MIQNLKINKNSVEELYQILQMHQQEPNQQNQHQINVEGLQKMQLRYHNFYSNLQVVEPEQINSDLDNLQSIINQRFNDGGYDLYRFADWNYDTTKKNSKIEQIPTVYLITRIQTEQLPLRTHWPKDQIFYEETDSEKKEKESSIFMEDDCSHKKICSNQNLLIEKRKKLEFYVEKSIKKQHSQKKRNKINDFYFWKTEYIKRQQPIKKEKKSMFDTFKKIKKRKNLNQKISKRSECRIDFKQIITQKQGLSFYLNYDKESDCSNKNKISNNLNHQNKRSESIKSHQIRKINQKICEIISSFNKINHTQNIQNNQDQNFSNFTEKQNQKRQRRFSIKQPQKKKYNSIIQPNITPNELNSDCKLKCRIKIIKYKQKSSYSNYSCHDCQERSSKQIFSQ